MDIIYAQEDLPVELGTPLLNSVFLAGPTPRSPDVESWRPDAVKIFADQGFNGTLIMPEEPAGGFRNLDDSRSQPRWEWRGIGHATCLMFWIPRNLETMPAPTTNIELGLAVGLMPEKTIVGAPEEARKMGYVRQLCEELPMALNSLGVPADESPIPTFYTLEETITAAIEKSKSFPFEM